MPNREKIKPLRAAIQEHILPGMSIHVSDFFSYPIAAIMEITRQFWQAHPQFTLIISGLSNELVPLMVGGCIEKVIHSFAGDIFPTPGPNPIFQEYFKENRIKQERWSMASLNMRLAAGAMNIGYLPTRSLIGSDLAKENPATFKLISDPFDGEEPLGLVKALHPDITLIHGIIGDALGNTIIAPSSAGGIEGVFASKQGAVVTVERIVPESVLRNYSYLVKIPGHLVQSISQVPFGAHPWSLVSFPIQEVEGYDYDHSFLTKARRVSEKRVDLEEFIRQWILSCADHETYLEKVGQAHLKGLKKRYRQAAIRELKPFQVQKTHPGPVSYTPQEIRIFTVGMKIATIIREKRYPLVVAGIGIGNLASWIAKELLRREDIHFELAVDYGIIGYQPQPGDPFILSLNTIFSSTILTGVTQMYNQFFQKGRNRTLGVLGGGQVDKVGNLNSTFIPPDLFLPGSGGANDIASYSDEVLVTMPQSIRRFVDRVSYVTCPGDNIRTLISDLGVFEKPQGEREFLLTEYFCFSKTDHEQECIAKIQEQCGWHIKVAPGPKAIMNPPPLFMDVLDAFDPRGLFRKGFY